MGWRPHCRERCARSSRSGRDGLRAGGVKRWLGRCARSIHVRPARSNNRIGGKKADACDLFVPVQVVKSGGLVSHGYEGTEQFQPVATYVDRILRGEKPGTLPLQLPSKYQMVVNLKAAKAIELSIPPAFILRADEVLE